MKIKQLKNLRTFLIPFLLIIICIFWIIRVELKAAELATRVEEYHKVLEQGNDFLKQIQWFYREIDNNIISILPAGIDIKSSKGNYITNTVANSHLDIEDKNIIIWTMGDVPIGLNVDGGTFLELRKDEMSIASNGELTVVGGSTPKNNLYMGNSNFKIESGDGKDLIISSGRIAGIKITLSDNGESIVIDNEGLSKITLKKDQVYIDAKADINFTAKGDINMISENGSVNLFGKTINFNE